MTSSANHRRLQARLQEGAARLDWLMESDRLFFRSHPHRNHRLRPVAPIEIEQALILEEDAPPPPGTQWFTLVRQVVPGVRMRGMIALPIGTDPDTMSERDVEKL